MMLTCTSSPTYLILGTVLLCSPSTTLYAKVRWSVDLYGLCLCRLSKLDSRENAALATCFRRNSQKRLVSSTAPAQRIYDELSVCVPVHCPSRFILRTTREGIHREMCGLYLQNSHRDHLLLFRGGLQSELGRV